MSLSLLQAQNYSATSRSAILKTRVANLVLPIVPNQTAKTYQINTKRTKTYKIQITYLIYLKSVSVIFLIFLFVYLSTLPQTC